MGGGVFAYIVDLSNELIREYDMYIASHFYFGELDGVTTSSLEAGA